MGWGDIINDDSIRLDMTGVNLDDLEPHLEAMPDEEVDVLIAELRKTVAEANSRKAIINNAIAVARVVTKLLV
jgi:hypothetical protein